MTGGNSRLTSQTPFVNHGQPDRRAGYTNVFPNNVLEVDVGDGFATTYLGNALPLSR